MREYGGKLSFNPRLLKGLTRLRFSLTVRRRLLEVEIKADTATYCLSEGAKFTFCHGQQEITLAEGESRSVNLAHPANF